MSETQTSPLTWASKCINNREKPTKHDPGLNPIPPEPPTFNNSSSPLQGCYNSPSFSTLFCWDWLGKSGQSCPNVFDPCHNALVESGDEDELEEKIDEEEEAETTEGTILGEEVIATDQTEPELVLIDDSEKENFPIEEIEPNREVMKDKPC